MFIYLSDGHSAIHTVCELLECLFPSNQAKIAQSDNIDCFMRSSLYLAKVQTHGMDPLLTNCQLYNVAPFSHNNY